MDVTVGKRLGPYEIVSRIGAGGMGEVFRARDTRLERSVAIKVLPPEFASNAALKLRFEREAKSISQLNHPHICTLHDVGSDDGVEYLVMELIEGETLADRIARSPLPLADVLRYGAQIAEALDAAHAAGIIHRDLKPGNVMLTKSGAKLLDFGLASSKEVVGAGNAHEQVGAESRTAFKPLTAEGTILGTFQYMAPEQLEGLEADARTDIFAFGVLLYEMASGRRAFEGKTRTSLIAAIVGAEPRPLAEVQPLTPPALEHVIRRCLEKQPDDRWQSARDVSAELKWISQAGVQSGIASSRTRSGSVRERLAWVALLIAASLGAAAVAWKTASKESPVLTASINPPPQSTYDTDSPPALSPDGRFIASVIRGANGRRSLYARALDGSWERSYAGSDDAQIPFWSTDSARIAFHQNTKIKYVEREGSEPDEFPGVVTLPRGSSFAPDGTILFVSEGRIFRSREGREPIQITKPAVGLFHFWPEWLPDGKHFLLFQSSGQPDSQNGIAIANAETGAVKFLVASFSRGIAVNDSLIFSRGRSRGMSMRRIDLEKLELRGPELRLKGDFGFLPGRGTLLASATPDHLVYFQAGTEAADTRLVIVDRKGTSVGSIGEPARYYAPRVSNDGNRVAVDKSDPVKNNGDIWIFDLKRSSSSRISYDESDESTPVWSRDDSALTYFRETKDGRVIVERSASGTGSERSLGIKGWYPSGFSPDGRYLSFTGGNEQNFNVGVYDAQTRKIADLLATRFYEVDAEFHPSGRWFAYVSNESGQTEVYVQSFPAGSGKWMVSVGGGSDPVWSRDGKELFFLSSEKVTAVAVSASDSTFDHGPPAPLFPVRLRQNGANRQYDVMPDGRFVLNVLVEAEAKPLTIVSNWKH